MKTQPSLNPSDFVVAPHVAAVDEFRMDNGDGTFVADINEQFLVQLVQHMNEREAATGDLAPLVIGHTKDGEPETAAPPVVGYARNWHLGDLGSTGRKAAFFDAWVFKDEVERVRRYPRRSCEVWVRRHEVDPISLLGATTPARDLGLLKLSRGGSFTYETSGAPIMAAEDAGKKESPDKPKADPKETGKAVHENATLEAVIAGQKQMIELLTKLTCGTGPGLPDMGPAPQPDQAGAAPNEGDLSDEELEKLLGQMGGEGGEEAGKGAAPEDEDKESRAGEKPVQNSASAGGMNTNTGSYMAPDDKARLSRLESDNEALRVQLSRRDVLDKLKELSRTKDGIDPTDEAHVADLIAMPPDMRQREFDRLAKLSRPKLGAGDTVLLNSALADATTATASGGPKVMRTKEEQQAVMKLARDKGIDWVAACKEMGYLAPRR